MVNIDTIVRRVLFQKSLPIHWYGDFMSAAIECVQGLHYDAMRKTKVVKLDVDSMFSAELPSDYVDWVVVGFERGQFVIPLAKNKRLNKIEGDEAYDSAAISISSTYWDDYLNNYNEDSGKRYGYTINHIGFEVFKDDGRIQLDPDYDLDYVILEYVTDGIEAGGEGVTAVYIDEYAVQAVMEYINWKYKENDRTFNRLEVQQAKAEYYNEYRKLRGRMAGLTKEDILRASRRRFKQSIKT